MSLPLEVLICDGGGEEPKLDQKANLNVKSIILSVRSFLQARPNTPVKLILAPTSSQRASKWIDAWLPRRVQIDSSSGNTADTMIRATSPAAAVVVVDDQTFMTPDAIILLYETIQASPLNVLLSPLDVGLEGVAEIRIVGSRHWRVLSGSSSIPIAGRGVTMASDWAAWDDPERQAAHLILQGRVLLCPLPAMASRGTPSPCVPWDRLAQMVSSQT